MRSRKISHLKKNSVAFIFLFISFTGFIILIISILKLPESSQFKPDFKMEKPIGNFGKTIIEMLPENLGFTVFLPSETAFERDLRLIWNESFVDEKMKDDSYAILTRILGFCAVPRVIYSSDLNLKKNGEIQEVDYDSIDGFRLYISRGNEEDGMIVVNRVRSEMVDVVLATKKKIVVHVMDGVVMDSEFEQAVLPE